MSVSGGEIPGGRETPAQSFAVVVVDGVQAVRQQGWTGSQGVSWVSSVGFSVPVDCGFRGLSGVDESAVVVLVLGVLGLAVAWVCVGRIVRGVG